MYLQVSAKLLSRQDSYRCVSAMPLTYFLFLIDFRWFLIFFFSGTWRGAVGSARGL